MTVWYGFCKEYEGGAPVFIVEAPSSFLAVNKIVQYVINTAIDDGEIDELWIGDTGFEIKRGDLLLNDERQDYDNDDNNIHL